MICTVPVAVCQQSVTRLPCYHPPLADAGLAAGPRSISSVLCQRRLRFRFNLISFCSDTVPRPYLTCPQLTVIYQLLRCFFVTLSSSCPLLVCEGQEHKVICRAVTLTQNKTSVSDQCGGVLIQEPSWSSFSLSLLFCSPSRYRQVSCEEETSGFRMT